MDGIAAAPSTNTATGPNDDPVDDDLTSIPVPVISAVITPSASVQVPANLSGSTTTGNYNDPVDDLARVLSRLLIPPPSAQDPAVVIKDYLLPCLDTSSICKLAVLHPDLHHSLCTSAVFAGKAISVDFHEINKPLVSARGRRIRPPINPNTIVRFASFLALPAFANVRALDLITPYMDHELADTILTSMPQLASLSLSTRECCNLTGRRLNTIVEGNLLSCLRLSDRPLVWDLFRSLPNLREHSYQVTDIKNPSPFKKFFRGDVKLHTLHVINQTICNPNYLVWFLKSITLSSLRCLTLVNFGDLTVNSVRHILRACRNLRQLSFRFTDFSGSLESVQAWGLGIESHPDFVDRPPGWSSKVFFDDYYNSTGLYCFVPTGADGEDEQEGGEGIMMDSALGSLAPFYEDLIRNNTCFVGWEVRKKEFQANEEGPESGSEAREGSIRQKGRYRL